MTKEEALKRLEKDLFFDPRTASAYVRAKGLCEYCGQELIFNRLGYACAQIDHLLPRAKYSDDITGTEENFVLSCSLCNGLKRDAPILEPEENPESMLKSHRDELIARSIKIIKEKLREPDNYWDQAKIIFKELGYDRE